VQGKQAVILKTLAPYDTPSSTGNSGKLLIDATCTPAEIVIQPMSV